MQFGDCVKIEFAKHISIKPKGMMKVQLLLIYTLAWVSTFAQPTIQTKWWNPVQNPFPVIEGQAWSGEVKSPYDRLPARAEGKVADAVWGLSHQTAGVVLRFRCNAERIVVRYGVKNKGTFALNHMPATGVSGLDLYAIDSEGQELWCASRRSFGDTIHYRYESLNPNDRFHQLGREYRLYLPLYNQVEWLEIGVADSVHFQPLPVRPEKPIVVYGTSIAQGACASRPGMAWTAILGRKMDRPLVNLGFSGSGKLEQPLIDLMAEIEAKIYVLDCLPNLTSQRISDAELQNKVLEAVRALKQKRPATPILLVEHAGYTEEYISDRRQENYRRPNRLQREAFYQLQKEGVQGLYYLTKEEIGLQMDDMVDGVHPTDLGMQHYADSYEQKLRSILQEPVGSFSTTQPLTQYREPHNYDWEERHREILKMNATDPPQTVFLANSIIHFWGGLPRTQRVVEEASWEKHFTPQGMRNLAYGWDRIENVLWRVYHGELDGFEAERVLLMIGTNNLHLNTNEEILVGLDLLLAAIKNRQPQAEIVLLGLLPRRNREERIAALNLEIARLAGKQQVQYADMGGVFLNDAGKIDEALFSDGLHPNAEGYRRLREEVRAILEKSPTEKK
jgi:lysophospholipase L1-like esterase